MTSDHVVFRGCTYTNGDGTALAALLARKRVRRTKVVTPVSATDGDNAELGNDDGGTDGGSDFLGGLDTETDVALGVTNDDDGLETGTLTGTGLLLNGLDLFVWQYVSISLEFAVPKLTAPPAPRDLPCSPSLFVT